jgi:hypothetical protein
MLEDKYLTKEYLDEKLAALRVPFYTALLVQSVVLLAFTVLLICLS